MNIYISGISGTGMGPLALMAKNAGHEVFGSDRNCGIVSNELDQAKITFEIGDQDGSFLKQTHRKYQIDWFVYTSALSEDHPELQLARSLKLKISKRDELTAMLIKELNLKMIAVAGTHGKTTTTAMLIWIAKKLNLPAAYIVGSTLSFAPSGSYRSGDRYFIYEADEYDRNFLTFSPWLSLITFVSFDHPDIYHDEKDYKNAFLTFEQQSKNLIFATPQAVPEDLSLLVNKNPTILLTPDSRLTLAGSVRREDATLVLHAIRRILQDHSEKQQNPNLLLSSDQMIPHPPDAEILKYLNDFPGVGRRFERLMDGIYSDYAHHPEEIKATIEIAKEEAKKLKKKGIVVIYQPHQNTRQHEVFHLYKDIFKGVDHLFWLPTYLTRENKSLKVYTPSDFIDSLAEPDIASPADLDEKLAESLKDFHRQNYLIILMSAGPADIWLRDFVKNPESLIF